MKTIFLLWLCWLLLSCGYTTVDELGSPDNCRFRVDRGFIIKWRSLPIPIYAHASLPSLPRQNFLYAIDMWNEAWNYHTGEGPLFEFMGNTDVRYTPRSKAEDRDGISIIYMDKKHYVLEKEIQATTDTLNTFGGIMVEADVIFNGIHQRWHYEKTGFDYLAYTKIPALSTGRYLASTSTESFWRRFLYAFQGFLDFWTFWKKKVKRAPSADKPRIRKNESDFISVAIHELGHHAGLGHIDDRKSIMNTNLSTGAIRRDIEEFELSSLACGYKMEKAPRRSLASSPSIDQIRRDSFWRRILKKIPFLGKKF